MLLYKKFLNSTIFSPQEKKIRISSKNTHTSNNLFRAVFQLFVWKPILRVTDRELKPLFPGYACCSNKLTCECVFPGAHQMEPPSSLNSWVNPFPSRFINRTACFPRTNKSYFRESRMSPWKNEVGWSRTQRPVLRPFSFFPLRPFLQFYSRWDLGIMK